MPSNCGVGEDSRIPWTAKRPNQSTLNEINPGYSLEGLMLNLKFQYFGHLMWRADSLEKILMLGKIEGRRRRERQRMRLLDGTIDWLNGHEFEQALGDGEGQETWRQSMGSQRVGHDWVTKHKRIYALHQTLTFQNDDKIIKILLDCEINFLENSSFTSKGHLLAHTYQFFTLWYPHKIKMNFRLNGFHTCSEHFCYTIP